MTEVPVYKLSVVYQPIEALTAYSRNARKHKRRQIRQIADSIKLFGFTNPVLLDKQNRIIAGHGRVAAAKLLGLTEVPTICLEHLTEDQLRAYIIADNRLAELAGWDKEILGIELQHLLTIIDFDVAITGFEVAEVDLILLENAQSLDAEAPLPQTMGPAITRFGDLWHLGRHRVLCGDSLQQASFTHLLGHRQANVVFCDPPFNTHINGHACGNGSIRHREFIMASGEMSESEFVSFLTSSMRLLALYSTTGSVHFICADWRHTGEFLAAGKQVYDSFLNLAVWVKNVGGMGSFYRSQHELIFVFRNGKGKHRNNIQLGKYGRNRTNVWQYPGVNTLSKQTDEGNLLALHPTVKPVALVADALLDCSSRGDRVLDAFLGSGSTLIAAERTGRVCHGIELDPIYVDTAIQRWQRYTGDYAIHAVSGKAVQ